MKTQARQNYALPNQIAVVVKALKQTNATVYLVGGILRDSLLKAPNPDIDIAVVGNAQDVGNIIADTNNGKCFELDSLRGIYRVVSPGAEYKTQIDIATIQDEIHSDISNRDFTINTLALNLKWVTFDENIPRFEISRIINNHNGIEDLKNGLLRMTNNQVFE